MDAGTLEARITARLDGRGDVTIGPFLHGDGVFLDGRLVAAVLDGELCLQVTGEVWESHLDGPGVRAFRFGDLPVPGWLVVEADGLGDDDLSGWIEMALAG